MFVTRKTYARAVRLAENMSANAERWKALSEDLLKRLEDSSRRHAITETNACNQASRANDLQRQLDARKPVRGANGKFATRTVDAPAGRGAES
jgi:hypothetical protein